MHSELRFVIDYFLHVDLSLWDTSCVIVCLAPVKYQFHEFEQMKEYCVEGKKGILVKGEVGCEEVNHSLSRVDRIVNISQWDDIIFRS